MIFILKFLILTIVTIYTVFLPEILFAKYYRALFVVYMLIVGVIFIL